MSKKLPGKATCPKCGKGADGWTETEFNTFPATGDVCICCYCGSINVYDITENKALVRFPTDEELAALLKEIPDLHEQAAAALHKGKDYFENS